MYITNKAGFSVLHDQVVATGKVMAYYSCFLLSGTQDPVHGNVLVDGRATFAGGFLLWEQRQHYHAFRTVQVHDVQQFHHASVVLALPVVLQCHTPPHPHHSGQLVAFLPYFR